MTKKVKVPRSGQDRRAKRLDPIALAKKSAAGAGGSIVIGLLFKIMWDSGNLAYKVETIDNLIDSTDHQLTQRMDSMHISYNSRITETAARMARLEIAISNVERGEQECLRRIGRVEDRASMTIRGVQ